jgi:hypothetical protein
MRSSKRKTVMKHPKKNVFKSAPAVVFVLVFLLGIFLIDLYRVVHSTAKKHNNQKNEHIDKKGHGDDDKMTAFSERNNIFYLRPVVLASALSIATFIFR